MAESADAPASGAGPRKGVEVQVLLSAPDSNNPNTIQINGVFGLFFIFDNIFLKKSLTCFYGRSGFLITYHQFSMEE